MRQYITISLDIYNGEAKLTPKSQEIINQMIENRNLRNFQLMDDMRNIFFNAFERIQTEYKIYIDELIAQSRAKMEKDNAT
jgi:hypothetical protein